MCSNGPGDMGHRPLIEFYIGQENSAMFYCAANCSNLFMHKFCDTFMFYTMLCFVLEPNIHRKGEIEGERSCLFLRRENSCAVRNPAVAPRRGGAESLTTSHTRRATQSGAHAVNIREKLHRFCVCCRVQCSKTLFRVDSYPYCTVLAANLCKFGTRR